MAFRQRLFWLFVLSLFCWGTATVWQAMSERQNQRYARLADEVQEFVVEGIRQQESALDSLSGYLNEPYLNLRRLNNQLGKYQFPGFSFFVFEGDDPVFWSDNQVLPNAYRIRKAQNGSLFFTGNGWYILSYREHGQRLLASLFLIRYQYPFQNYYLSDHFNEDMNLPENARLFNAVVPGTWAITGLHDDYLFSLGFLSTGETPASQTGVAILYGFAFLFLFLLLTDVMLVLARRNRISGLLLLLAVIGLRLLLNYLRLPCALFTSEVFSPRYYASGFLLNSPGDLLLTVAVIIMIILYFYYRINHAVLRNADDPVDHAGLWSVMVTVIFLLTFLFSVFINYLLSGLVINSQISFNVGNVFELSGYSLAGMTVFGSLLFALYLLCDCAVRFLRRTGFTLAYASVLFLISQGLFLIILLVFRDWSLFSDYGVSAFILTNSLVIFISYIRITEKRLFSFSRSVMALVVFSLYAAQLIYSYNMIREHDKRQLLAAKLENEQDLVAEFLLEDLSRQISNDTILVRHVTEGAAGLTEYPMANENLDKRLMRIYFGGYLNRYEVRFRYFDREERPVNIAGDPTWNLDLIRKQLKEEGRQVHETPFYYLPQTNGRIVYAGLIPIRSEKTLLGYVSIEMNARYMQEEAGFPGLLLSSRPGIQQELSNYSFARYQNNRLVTQSGPFNYYLTPVPYEASWHNLNGMRFTHFEGYSHLFYRFGNDGLIIISQQEQSAWAFLTLFSYIFIFFSIVFLFLYFIIRVVRQGFRPGFNFKTRIQLTVILIVIATLTLTGAATVAYIVDNYKKAQNLRIREKVNNILLLIESRLAGREKLEDPVGDDLIYSFSELANTLGTDFNLYNLNGKLLFTTQSRIYDQELTAPIMNRDAFTRLTTNQKALFTETEKIGNLSYLAGYEHIRNNSNQTIGYLSLPYFARESELKRDISTFLIALINIYILLFSLAILAAFVISNRVTLPLRIIQDSLRRMKLGGENELIEWNSKDEIGALIKEYNRTVNKLQESAELLAKSERESAWREMARQVAHEIKNPLTPMKLGVQHLLRAWEDDHTDKEDLLKRIGDTLIEQIDTLTNIANEFSNFAKMPKPEYTQVDLSRVLKQTADLYNETENARIVLDIPQKKLWVLADKDQLVRIFSNLVKNAVQAIPPDRQGLIKIEVIETTDFYDISVQDNGSGIPKEQIDRIFTPNFTTKSGGTGLGLAMVKNMVTMMEGDIWFTTVENKGTSFFIRLRKA